MCSTNIPSRCLVQLLSLSDTVSMGLALSCPSWHTQPDPPTPSGLLWCPSRLCPNTGVPFSLPFPGCLPAGGSGAAAMQPGWGGPEQERPDWGRARGGSRKNKPKHHLSTVWQQIHREKSSTPGSLVLGHKEHSY